MPKAARVLYYIFILFLILPLISLILWCFVTKWSVGEPFFANFTLDGWRYFANSGDLKNAVNSSLYATFIAVLSVIISVFCARAMVITNKYSKITEALFYLPLLFPPIAIIIGFHSWALKNLSYQWLPLVMAYLFFSFPYAFSVIYAAYKQKLKEAISTAYNLGAKHYQIIFSVELPILKNHLAAAFVLAYGVCYGQYLVAAFFEGNNKFIIQMTHFLGSSNRNISATYTLVYIVFALAVFLPQLIYKKIKSGGDIHLFKG